ncbi:TIGR03943 family protein [Bacillus sp. ISL-40]|uniref:TIGR03943 family putative permease subunit n=1 Tax=unclassified Bacillus (in: firmicutes) TaxID=185979 RepID=UPI001BEBD677|nr:MULTISPECIES: TIGR03943 family protein [unclassified Bacillus (in: firmicutes)]MBT2696139.1 TIGR03943 family protein [Bacillus sp. ISL-40]MBT2742986.1 TIGR03943 family protein [Bacillus sp. ISL-77]
MQFHFQQAIRAFILLSFSCLLFKMHFTGEMTKFINPKYEGLSQIASIIFLILFFIQYTRIWSARDNSHHHCHHDEHNCNHDHGDSRFNTKKIFSYFVIVFPLLTGFLIPAKVLDASIANKKGAMLILSNQTQAPQDDKNQLDSKPTQQREDTNINRQEESPESDAPVDPNLLENQKDISEEEYAQLIKKLEQKSNIVMNDYVFAAYYEEISKDINKFKGRKIKLKGFIYKEDGLSHNHIVISRFLITHCVADASIIGFLSEFSEPSSLVKDTWVEAEGVLDITTFNGTELPLIKITGLKKINEPEKPYLYPISIKIL